MLGNYNNIFYTTTEFFFSKGLCGKYDFFFTSLELLTWPKYGNWWT